jgi:serine phosphatase RsbU (regulator of sigma subunit)
MRSAAPHVRLFWFRALMAGGALLALTMLVQTVMGYRYVTGALLLQQGKREGERVTRQIEEGVRSANASAAAPLGEAVDAAWRDAGAQAAWIVVVDDQNQVLAARGRDRASSTPAERTKAFEDETGAARFEDVGNGRVIVGSFPCRCSVGGARRRGQQASLSDGASTGDATPRQPRGPVMVEVALYPGGLSAPFSRVRRQAAINALTACALLGALVSLAFRFRSYIKSAQMEVQLDAARRVQRELMPVDDARVPGVEVAASCTPASHVGGDLVDLIPLPRGRVGLMLGDVSGKGMSAALLTGLVQGAMTASATDLGGDEPELAAGRINDLLVQKTSGERFASLFWCSFDPSDATLRYVNAGHPPAFLVRAHDRSVEKLDVGGPVFGVLAHAPYGSGCTTVAPGDLLVVFSDGIAEAADERDEEFGAERIAAAVQEHRTSSARGICDAVLTAVDGFADRNGARDDRTLLVVRFTTECPAFSRQGVTAMAAA